MRPILDGLDTDRYLHVLVERLRATLADRLVGAWLINSAARGDYLPGRSDLDVTVGVTDRLDQRMKRRVADELRHGTLPVPAPRLELVVYRMEVLAAPGERPDWELNLNTGPAIADHVGTEPAAEPAHWFVLDLAAAGERSRAIAGPPLGQVLGGIDDPVVLAALQASATWHADHDAAAPNRVLNACRAWRWLETGSWSSKTGAATWAIEAGGDEALIRLALGRRGGEGDRPLTRAAVASFVAGIEQRLLAASLASSRSASVTGILPEQHGRAGAPRSRGT
ncbi:MAG: DUF4111 domain-containing protein [Chloroflexi bacterium]|nr:DUF4111 domain-containing protein [Chloroflexota bacterium]